MSCVNRIKVLTFQTSPVSLPNFKGSPSGALMELAGMEDQKSQESNTTYCNIHLYSFVPQPSRLEIAVFESADWFLAFHPMRRGIYYQCGFLDPAGAPDKLIVDGPFSSAFYFDHFGRHARLGGNALISQFLLDTVSGRRVATRFAMDNCQTEFQKEFNALCDRDDQQRPSREQINRSFAEFVGNASTHELYRRCTHVLKFGHPLTV